MLGADWQAETAAEPTPEKKHVAQQQQQQLLQHKQQQEHHAAGSACAQHEGANAGNGSCGGGSRRLFGIVGDGQSHWQPLVREANEVMELAGLNTDWLLHDLLVYADAVYA